MHPEGCTSKRVTGSGPSFLDANGFCVLVNMGIVCVTCMFSQVCMSCLRVVVGCVCFCPFYSARTFFHCLSFFFSRGKFLGGHYRNLQGEIS